MRYKVTGLTIKSENAAKPISQSSQWVLRWISSLPKSSIVLDYGCGKFRYTIPLSRKVRAVYSVDSIHQLDKVQIINNKKTTLRDYAKRYLRNVVVCDTVDDKWRQQKYHYVLCSNVLSAIPNKRKRTEILKLLSTVLRPNGKLFVCTQYRNSYFKAYANYPNAKRFRDGWLITKKGTAFFYGIIPPTELAKLCQKAGFHIIECYSKGESAYVTAKN